MPVDPRVERREQRVVDPHVRRDGRALRFVQHDAQAQARRAAAVLHAFAQVEHQHVVNRAVAGREFVEIGRDVAVLAAFLRHDEHLRAVRARQQLAVEQVRRHRVVHAHGGLGHLDHVQARTACVERSGQRVVDRLLVDERALVREQRVAVADRDHVVVEHARVDHVRILLRIDRRFFGEAVAMRDRAARLEGLARREALRLGPAAVFRAAVHEELDARLAVFGAEARVVRRAFVAECRRAGQRFVHREMRGIGEQRRQRAARRFVLDRTMQLAAQVRRREVHAAVARVGRRADGGRVRGPHRRCRARRGEQFGRLFRGLRDHVRVLAGEAELSQQAQRRPLLRRQHALREAEIRELLHLAQPLFRGGLRVRGRLLVVERRHVAERQPGVVVGRADEPVEIAFLCVHRRSLDQKCRPGDRLAGKVSCVLSTDAIGYAQ